MKSVALGSLFALILSMGLFVSQAEAKNNDDKNENKGKNNYASNDKHEYKEYRGDYRGKGSVPIPGTLLLFGGGFAGLIVWRTRQPRS